MQNEIESTIQLDKLGLCCTSTVEDNFNHAIMFYPDEAFKYSHSFGKTILTQAIDDSRRYKYCYMVNHAGYCMGKIKFCLLGQPHHDDKVWLQIANKVFYNNTLQFLPSIFENLNLHLNNVTKVEIALDSYVFFFEPHIRRCLRNKDNKVKLLGRYINRKALEQRIRYWNYGSLDNPFKVRTLYIKSKRKISYPKKKKQGNNEEPDDKKNPKTTIELIAYNKLEEIQNFSPHKTYILDYHKAHNPNYKHIYREEIRLESEELRRLEKKRKSPITLADLLSKEFLYEVFTEYIDRIIVIKDSKGKKIDLFPKPFLGDCEGKLPLTLPQSENAPQLVENKEISIIENENIFFNNKEDLREDFEEIIYNNPIYFEYHENNKEIIGNYQAENQSIPEREQESQFWEAPFPYP
jgi:hypothetical protein